jgi:hypothetical protein
MYNQLTINEKLMDQPLNAWNRIFKTFADCVKIFEIDLLSMRNPSTRLRTSHVQLCWIGPIMSETGSGNNEPQTAEGCS